MAKSSKDLIKKANKELAKMVQIHDQFIPFLVEFDEANRAFIEVADGHLGDPNVERLYNDLETAKRKLRSIEGPCKAQLNVLESVIDALNEKQTRKELKGEYEKAEKVEACVTNLVKYQSQWTDESLIFKMIN